MKRRPAVAVVAAGAALALALAGCGGSKSTKTASATPADNAGGGQVFNPSDKKGGTLRFAHSGDWDSLDPADTYYGYSWDFIRLYGRSLTMFTPKPGADGNKLIPDLAESLGQPSDGAKTWTYKIKKNIKYEDGSVVTSKDIKYAVERSLDKDSYPNG